VIIQSKCQGHLDNFIINKIVFVLQQICIIRIFAVSNDMYTIYNLRFVLHEQALADINFVFFPGSKHSKYYITNYWVILKIMANIINQSIKLTTLVRNIKVMYASTRYEVYF